MLFLAVGLRTWTVADIVTAEKKNPPAPLSHATSLDGSIAFTFLNLFFLNIGALRLRQTPPRSPLHPQTLRGKPTELVGAWRGRAKRKPCSRRGLSDWALKRIIILPTLFVFHRVFRNANFLVFLLLYLNFRSFILFLSTRFAACTLLCELFTKSI